MNIKIVRTTFMTSFRMNKQLNNKLSSKKQKITINTKNCNHIDHSQTNQNHLIMKYLTLLNMVSVFGIPWFQTVNNIIILSTTLFISGQIGSEFRKQTTQFQFTLKQLFQKNIVHSGFLALIFTLQGFKYIDWSYIILNLYLLIRTKMDKEQQCHYPMMLVILIALLINLNAKYIREQYTSVLKNQSQEIV